MERAEKIIAIIQEVATRLDRFTRRGPGDGNKRTNQVVAEINRQVVAEFGNDICQQRLSPATNSSADFFLRAERVVIELEFSLSNPAACLERDALKALVARDHGAEIEHLILVGGPGSEVNLGRPAPKAVREWLAKYHRLMVTVREIGPLHAALVSAKS